MVHWANACYIYMLIYYEMGNNDYKFAESSHKKIENDSCASLDRITGVQSWCEISLRNLSIFTEFIDRKVDICLLMFTLD